MNNIVIIGGVAGGASAAARLRRLSEEDNIIIFEKGEYISFANCGLPYYIGDVIEERQSLLVQTVEGMSKRFNLDIRAMQEVTKINKEAKTLEVLNHKTNEIYEVSYDKLVIATGGEAIWPPIEGLSETTNVFKLKDIPDTDKIKEKTKNTKKAVVIGGGFIGVEIAENLAELGIDVTLVEKQNQLIATVDYEMACLIHREMEKNGIKLKLGLGVTKFEDKGNFVVLENGEKLESDLTILAIGTRPNSKLAKEAGLELSQNTGIIVNENLLTSDSNIYACGDVIETKNLITGGKQLLALAGVANRQARVIANNINGIKTTFNGVIGTSAIKVFDLTIASTGLTERALTNMDIKYCAIHAHRGNHAEYYPNVSTITIKLIFNKEDGKILGAQAIGKEGTEKRIDVIATAIKANMNVYDLSELELCYAPPFSSAKDPSNIVGYIATNVLEERYKIVHFNEIDLLAEQKAFIVDVRTSEEFNFGNIKGSINIPIDDLRSKLNELPKDKDTNVYMYCAVGFRGYLATQILKNNGYKNVYNLSGGYNLYDTTKN